MAGCLKSQQHAGVSQGRICSDDFTCCHTEIEVADQTFYLTQSQYTDTGQTSPSADPITPDAWQGSHWSASFEVTGMTRPRKKSRRKRDSNPGPSALEADALPLGQRGGPLRRSWLAGCLTSQQHAGVSQGRICLTSQQHAGVSQGRICLTSQQYAGVSQGRICLTPKQHASVSQGRICLTPKQHAGVSQGRICLTSQQHASVSQGRICLTSQQHASVSQGRIYSNKCTCHHTETEVADQIVQLTQSHSILIPGQPVPTLNL